jgi:hypothetical protein
MKIVSPGNVLKVLDNWIEYKLKVVDYRFLQSMMTSANVGYIQVF